MTSLPSADQARVSLDLSGDSLHRRGYRSSAGEAPLKESLAAAIVHLSGVRLGMAAASCLLDPMCGSGTILIEAAMIACNIPANINRDRFGFQTWKDYDETLYEKIVEASLNKTREFHYRIEGYDKAP